MKIKLPFFLLLFGFSIISHSQKARIQDYCILDTTFSFNVPNKFFRDDLAIEIYNEDVWIYIPGKRTDTLDFIRINLRTFEKKNFHCPFPSMYFKVDGPVSVDLSVSDDFMCLSFDGAHKLIVLNRNKNKLKLKEIIPIKEHVEKHFIKGDYLFFAKNYNFHKNDSPTKTTIGKYNLVTGFLEETVHPKFEAIEFSHFSPNQWIDFSTDYTLFAQTVRPEFVLYNNQLKMIDTLRYYNPNAGNSFSSEEFQRLTANVNGGKPMIYALEGLEDTLCRVEAVYFLNNNTFIVQNKTNSGQKKNRQRSIDVWKKNKNGQFEFVKGGIIDTSFDLTAFISKKNYPVQLNYNNNKFGGGKLVQWKFDAPIDMTNKTVKQIQAEAEDYYMENDDTYVLKIFSLNGL